MLRPNDIGNTSSWLSDLRRSLFIFHRWIIPFWNQQKDDVGGAIYLFSSSKSQAKLLDAFWRSEADARRPLKDGGGPFPN